MNNGSHARRLITPVAAAIFLFAAGMHAADDETEAKIRGIRGYAEQGSGAIHLIEPYLDDADNEVRWEAVRAIADIGGPQSLDPLVKATRDLQPEIQMRAVDGLVNFYLPGYVDKGFTASLKRAASIFRSRFSKPNLDVVDPYVQASPEVVAALGKLAWGGSSMESRANAARAIGILRGKEALPDLYEACKSKNGLVLFESLIAVQKISDLSSAKHVQYLIKDLEDRVQIAAIETAGMLRNHDAIADIRDVLPRARNEKIRRAALNALAMLPDESNRPLYTEYFNDKDEQLRAAAAEGFARLRKPEDLPMLRKAFQEENKMRPRLSMAFAVVMLGDHELSEFSALRYLINTLNSKLYNGYAAPLLLELARNPDVRKAIYPALNSGTKDEKIHLLDILSRTGDAETLPYLQAMSKDIDVEVAAEAARAANTLQARLPKI